MRAAFRAITIGLVFGLAATVCSEAAAQLNPFVVRMEVENLAKMGGSRKDRRKTHQEYQRLCACTPPTTACLIHMPCSCWISTATRKHKSNWRRH